MKTTPLPPRQDRTWMLVLETGEEIVERLTGFAKEHGLSAGRLQAVGALSDAMLGYFDWDAKEYRSIPVEEQTEVLSLLGDIATVDDEPELHAHVVLGDRDGRARGGHLLGGHVRPTLEVVVTEAGPDLRKVKDPESGLALIDPRAA